MKDSVRLSVQVSSAMQLESQSKVNGTLSVAEVLLRLYSGPTLGQDSAPWMGMVQSFIFIRHQRYRTACYCFPLWVFDVSCWA